MIWVTVFIVIVVVGAAVPVLHERGRQSMTPDLRKHIDGVFDGRKHCDGLCGG